MKTKKYLMASAMVIALGACNDEIGMEGTPYVPDEGEIQLLMMHPHQTRVTETSFENSDSIGVYVTASDAVLQLAGNEVNNELFTYNGISWTSKRKVYWNTGKHNVYAFYPYSKKVNDVVDYSFSVQTDQSTDWGYTHSDFLFASALDVNASASPVAMQFAHKMSNVIVNLEKGENFEGVIPANAEVYLLSTVPQAVIDLTTGDAAKDPYGAEATIRCRQLSNTQYQGIVVPQSLTSRRPLVEVVIGDVSYLMEGKISYRPGMRHTISVTLDQNPEQIKIEIGGSIEGWN